MLFSELFQKAGVQPEDIEGDAEIRGMSMDSRSLAVGACFVANPSRNSDSHGFIPSAKAAGAAAVVAHSASGFAQARSEGLPAAWVPNDGLKFNEASWRLAKVAFDNPSQAMRVVGVTGTNGKTTTAWLLRDMLRSLGVESGYVGTLGFQIPGHDRELSNTTPFAIELNALLAEARAAGVEAIAMEVSSHALAERRADGIEFDAAVFTNLTQDHLDFHGSMSAYEAAKMRLFAEFPNQSSKPFRGAVNLDDPAGRRFAAASANALTFGTSDRCELRGRAIQVRVDSIELELMLGTDVIKCKVPLGGSYNVENALSASGGLLALGYGLDDVATSLPAVRPVPGRFEAVANEAGIGILVDYAHTPDAVEKLLDAVRPLTEGRVITVFGCGGDRDRTKRPKMARAASERSDVTVVTSDNPRTEDPLAIVEEVGTGIVSGRDWTSIPDRADAIAHAIKVAREGDVVVIAGKGHENYQIIGRTKFPMDDRDLARAGLAAR